MREVDKNIAGKHHHVGFDTTKRWNLINHEKLRIIGILVNCFQEIMLHGAPTWLSWWK